MNPKSIIKFGTDGWRGVIADAFTFENVKIVSQAIADYINANSNSPKGIVIGYDNRFQGESFSRIVAKVMLGNKIPVSLAKKSLPTPAISFAAKHYELDGGVMITASHNPPEYSGVKFKTPEGASADPEITAIFETNVGESPVRSIEFDDTHPLLKNLEMEKPYLDWIKNFIDFKTLNKKSYKIIVDSMYGVGKNYVEQLLAGTGHDVTTIRGERNPSFNGIAPEPVPKNMNATVEAVRSLNADVAFVTDGDADRLAAMDNNGEYIITPKIATLIALHFLKNRGWTGSVIKTISCSVILDRFAKEYNLKLEEKPVGFKHIVPYLISGEALVGTEESGGLGIKNHIPERDGVLGSLIFLEALIGLGFNNAGEAMDYLDNHYGTLRYHRIDKLIEPDRKEAFLKEVSENPPKELLGKKIINIKDFDGIKFECEDDSWLLLRFSGTEPVVRFYAEAPTTEEAEALTKIGEEML
jgi:phosphomannomutase